MIHHVISAAIVAFVVGVVLILQNKIEDLQTELTDLNKKENELKTECVQFQAKVEFMEKSFDSLKASLDTIAVHTKRKEEQGKYITQYKYCIALISCPFVCFHIIQCQGHIKIWLFEKSVLCLRFHASMIFKRLM